MESRIGRVAVDVNVKASVAVTLDRHLPAALSFGGLFLLWLQLKLLEEEL